MPGIEKIKELHLAENLEQLQSQSKIPCNDPAKLVKITKKLFDSATEAQTNGDQEKAYLQFFKYVEVAKIIKRSREYKKDKIYYDSMVTNSSVSDAITHLEQLSDSLKIRYDEKQAKKQQKIEKIPVRNTPSPKNNGISNGVINHQIEPMKLYSIIQEKSTTFLLLDARPSFDYKTCHIKHTNSINVPEEFLSKGVVVKKIEKCLHVEDRGQWNRRTNTDMLILFDWQSEDFQENTPLVHLKDSLYHWDVAMGTNYKSIAYILKGGFENFALSYPTLVTNPQKSRPPTATKSNKASAIDIENVEYPDLDAAFIASPSPHASPAVTSGAITVSNPQMEVVNSPKRPKIPDRKTKPSDSDFRSKPSNNESDLRSSTASSIGGFNQAFVEEDVQPPIIDRSLKSKALLTIGGVLEAEKDIIEDSIRMDTEELKMEEEWEKLRLKRENEASEEMRAAVLLREEALLEKLEKMSLEKEQKERENQRLLDELENMKLKLDSKAQDQRVQDEIAKKKKEKEERKIHIDRLRKERIKKQNELKEIQQKQLLESQKRTEEARKKREETENAIRAKINKVPLKTDSEDSRSTLNRSHSSPNIAKMLNDSDESNAIIPTPKFDRSSKPYEIKNRNFSAIWGTSKKGLTGLRNLGNTCYMNSLLQCLSNFTLPSQYFIGENFRNDLNRNSEYDGEVAIEFAEVIKMLWSGQYKSFAPYEFKRILGKHNDRFRGNDQQDAHELLMFLMECLHKDVNLVRQERKIPEQNNDGLPEIEAANKAWENEKMADQSFIRETFYGQQRSTLTCPHCGWSSVTYESFSALPLQLPAGNKRCSLRQLIETYLSKDQAPYKCPTCKKERQVVKQFEIVKLPLILTVSLGRFYNHEGKKQNFVDFDLNDVNFGKYATACNGQMNRYKDYNLYGVCNHFGSLESGHYTAFCYSQVYRKWHKYDDNEVSEMSDAFDVKSPAAYILFYSAKN